MRWRGAAQLVFFFFFFSIPSWERYSFRDQLPPPRCSQWLSSRIVAHHHASPVSPPPNNNQQPEKKSNNHIFSPPPPPRTTRVVVAATHTHTQSLAVDFFSYLDRKELPPFVCVCAWKRPQHHWKIKRFQSGGAAICRNMCVQQQFRVCVIWWTRAQHPEGDDDYSKKGGGKLLRLFLFLFYPQGVNFIIQLFTED